MAEDHLAISILQLQSWRWLDQFETNPGYVDPKLEDWPVKKKPTEDDYIYRIVKRI